MRAAIIAVLIGWFCPAAHADHAPAVVIPGRPDVPVIINGRVVPPGSVIEGDWGLYRAGAVAPTVIPPPVPVLYWDAPVGRYFPATGAKPGYGRREIDQPLRPLRPAESYYRSWTAESQPGPVTIPAPYGMPPVVVAPPQSYRRGWRTP